MPHLSRRAWLTHGATQLVTTHLVHSGLLHSGQLPRAPLHGGEAPGWGAVAGDLPGGPKAQGNAGRVPGPGPGSGVVREIAPRDGAELQHELFRAQGRGDTLRLATPRTLVLPLREEVVGSRREISRQALLIPPETRLDLNGSTLRLELRSNGHGVRLSTGSAIRRGLIEIVASEGRGSQACWHSAVSVGAPYGDGGTPDQPGEFVTVSHWEVADLTIRQPFAAAGIQLMSEACWGVLRRITLVDSPRALLGIGMDWGTVGPLTAEDAQLPRMRRLWERGELYSTHPHDVLVEQLRVGRLTRHQDGNDAGLRCSACHHITVRGVQVAEAAVAVTLVGGDLGYEFARPDLRETPHHGYDLAGIEIERASLFGIVLNGLADNIWRAREHHGYEPVRNPTQPGLWEPRFRQVRLRGAGGRSQGIYAVSVTNGEFDHADISQFETGLHPEDWVNGLTLRHTRLHNNEHPPRIEGTRAPAKGVVVVPG